MTESSIFVPPPLQAWVAEGILRLADVVGSGDARDPEDALARALPTWAEWKRGVVRDEISHHLYEPGWPDWARAEELRKFVADRKVEPDTSGMAAETH